MRRKGQLDIDEFPVCVNKEMGLSVLDSGVGDRCRVAIIHGCEGLAVVLGPVVDLPRVEVLHATFPAVLVVELAHPLFVLATDPLVVVGVVAAEAVELAVFHRSIEMLAACDAEETMASCVESWGTSHGVLAFVTCYIVVFHSEIKEKYYFSILHL